MEMTMYPSVAPRLSSDEIMSDSEICVKQRANEQSGGISTDSMSAYGFAESEGGARLLSPGKARSAWNSKMLLPKRREAVEKTNAHHR